MRLLPAHPLSRTLAVIAWLALAMTVMLTLLPEMMRVGAIYLLERQEIQEVSIGDIDFNPFTGEFTIKQLSTSSGLVLNRASTRLDWWPLWRHKLAITELRGDVLKLPITQLPDGSLDIGGIHIPAADSGKSQQTDVDSAWKITLPGADFTHLDLTLSLPARDKRAAQRTHISLNDLYLHQLCLNRDGLRVKELRLDGFSSDDSAGQLPKSLRRLQLFGLTLDAGPRLQVDHANILDMKLAPATPLAGGSMARITLDKLQATPTGPLSLARLRIEDAVLPRHNTTQLGSFASLQLEKLKGDTPEHLSIASLSLRRLVLPADAASSLGSIDNISLQGMTLKINPDRPAVQANTVHLAGITLPSEASRQSGTIAAVEIDALSADAHQTAMAGLRIRDLQASLLRRADGAIAMPKGPITPATGQKSRQEKTIKAVAATPEPVLRIGHVSVTGNSHIDIRDESVTPVFKSTVTIRHLSMAPLVLGKPEAGELDLAVTFDGQSRLSARGSLTPDPGHPALNLNATLEELSLPELTPYIEQALHITIQTGQLDVKSKAQLANGTFTSENGVHIRRLQIRAGKGSPMVGGMGINTALEMIRDDAGDIDLDVPFSGPLNNLQAGLGDVINQALMTAMQKAALTYASQYLYPYGTIISIASTVARAAMAQPRLTPITFPPLQEKLDSDGVDYAGKIADLLLKKKGIRLQVCGVAAPAEAKAAETKRLLPDDEHLLDLARARSRRVVDIIAGRGVATDRLFACNPEIDRKDSAKGRVELLLE